MMESASAATDGKVATINAETSPSPKFGDNLVLVSKGEAS